MESHGLRIGSRTTMYSPMEERWSLSLVRNQCSGRRGRCHLAPLRRAVTCSSDNRLRSLRDVRYSASASTFCTTYLERVVTATSVIPTYVANCGAQPTRVSSACSCFLTCILPITGSATAMGTTSTAAWVEERGDFSDTLGFWGSKERHWRRLSPKEDKQKRLPRRDCSLNAICV